jgi:ATP-binding cassette, subfamily G (WHITE), member 2, SNQ2
MLDAIGAGANSEQKGDWAQVWLKSDEYQRVTEEIESICRERRLAEAVDFLDEKEYSMPWIIQMAMVTKRTFTSCWRDPNYLLGK